MKHDAALLGYEIHAATRQATTSGHFKIAPRLRGLDERRDRGVVTEKVSRVG